MAAGGGCKIGILGGIGPEATGEFYNKLILGLQEKKLIKSNKDFPQIIINSIPAPELIYDTISEEELEPYISGLKELDNFGVDFIVMVCNTIHLYHERLQRYVDAPILDLRQELRDNLMKNNISATLVIGTPNTIRMGLYRFRDIKTFEPDNDEISILSDAIFNFNRGIDKSGQIRKTKDICQKYIGKGSNKIILGCTEFAVMLGNEKDIPKVDTIDVLVNATIEKFVNKQLPQSSF